MEGKKAMLDLEVLFEQKGVRFNGTDLRMIRILYYHPDISNSKLAALTFLSKDGVRSALKRLYESFGINSNEGNKRVALVMSINKLIKEGSEIHL